jgi:transposase-like protein
VATAPAQPSGLDHADGIYIKVRGEWRYLYRAIDKHGTPVDFLLTARRDVEAAKRFFRKMLEDQPLLAPDRIGTDAAGPYPPAIMATRKAGLMAATPLHRGGCLKVFSRTVCERIALCRTCLGSTRGRALIA